MKRWLISLPGLATFVLWAPEGAPGLPEPFHIRAGIAYFLGLAPPDFFAAPFDPKQEQPHAPTTV